MSPDQYAKLVLNLELEEALKKSAKLNYQYLFPGENKMSIESTTPAPVNVGDTVTHRLTGDTCTVTKVTYKLDSEGKPADAVYHLKGHGKSLVDYDGYTRKEFWAKGEEPIPYKFNVGDRIVHNMVGPGTIIKQDGRDSQGDIVYNVKFDKGGTEGGRYFEGFMKAEPAKPKPAHKFRVGDRVTHTLVKGPGTVTKLNGHLHTGTPMYHVSWDTPTAFWDSDWYEGFMSAHVDPKPVAQPKFKVGDNVIVDQGKMLAYYGQVTKVRPSFDGIHSYGIHSYDVDIGREFGGRVDPLTYVAEFDITPTSRLYQPPTPHNIGWAVAQAKAGKKVARLGWNGKNMWVVFMDDLFLSYDKVNDRTKAHIGEGKDLNCGAYLVMMTASGVWQPGWLANQADLLATDWYVVE